MQYTCLRCGWAGEVNGRPRCLECARQSTKAWKARNKDRVKLHKASNLARRLAKDPEYLRRLQRQSKARNPERMREQYEQRKEWLMQGTVTKEELRRIWERDGGKCRYCGSSDIRPRFIPLHPRGFDHVVPRIKGGKHEALNLVVCCSLCNSIKGVTQDKP